MKINMANKEIIQQLQLLGSAPQYWHTTIYDDGIWSIEIERMIQNNIVFWAKRTDKRGYYKNTLVSMHEEQGEIKWMTSFLLKQTVLNKCISVYKALHRNGLA